METKVYVVRDAKAEAFKSPFFKHTHGEAERDFTTAVRDTTPNNPYNQYPEDFDLYFLGTYDDQTGLIKSLDTPQHIIKAVNVINRQ